MKCVTCTVPLSSLDVGGMCHECRGRETDLEPEREVMGEEEGEAGEEGHSGRRAEE